jgi:Zinc knuckle
MSRSLKIAENLFFGWTGVRPVTTRRGGDRLIMAPADGDDGENGENGENGERRSSGLPATFTNVIKILSDAYEELYAQNIKTPAAIQIKTKVCKEINKAIDLIETLRNTAGDNALTSLSELKNDLRELKEAAKAKTYAQASTVPASRPAPDPKATKVYEQRNKTRQERAKCEVTLLATTEPTKEKLLSMSYREITEGIQNAVNSNVQCDKKPKLCGVSKPTKDGTVRILCDNENEANMLRSINWETATEGLQARKPKFGIVIHGVNQDDFNTVMDPDVDRSIHQRIANENTLRISNIAPLRRKLNKDSHKHSIVIFTPDIDDADRCIKRGIYLNYCLYPAERYAPQFQITQCFNCGKFGHRASQCRQTHKTCGKCGENHTSTVECKELAPNCSNCHGHHENWHHECPTRIAERRRLKSLCVQSSLYFTP